MLEKPETYKEAKIIMKESANNPEFKRKRKMEKLRMGIFTAIGIAGAAALGTVMDDPVAATQIMVFPYSAAMFAELVPYLLSMRGKKKLEDGSFFEDKSQEEVMRMADEYVDAYNAYEAKKGGEARLK